jgi:hypothetical protein
MAYFAYYIPNGPTNLETFFPGIDFTTVAEYYIEIMSGGNVIATTPMTQLDGECCEDKVRIHFLNYLGAIDALNFKLDEDEHEAKSDFWQRPTKWDFTNWDDVAGGNGLIKDLHGGNRFNVKANNTLNLILSDYQEKDMGWINELIDSPLAWIEWLGIENQPNSYLPIIIQDAKIKDKKSTDAYINDVPVSIIYSHAKIIIRN